MDGRQDRQGYGPHDVADRDPGAGSGHGPRRDAYADHGDYDEADEEELDEVEDLGDIGDVDDEADFERRVARRRPGAAVEELLREAYDLIDQARPAALSTAVKIDREEFLDLLDQALERLPEELRSARWLLKEREEFLARTRREADEILDAARGQSERMVQRSEVMRAAEAKARRVIDESRAEAARIRNQCDDYCDRRLAQLEAVLERSMAVVSAGRLKLRPSVEGDSLEGTGDGGPATRPGPRRDPEPVTTQDDGQGAHVELEIFDQDRER